MISETKKIKKNYYDIRVSGELLLQICVSMRPSFRLLSLFPSRLHWRLSKYTAVMVYITFTRLNI